ncbi:MAG: hypothetical protein ABWX65_05045 [Mycetocola sp.]
MVRNDDELLPAGSISRRRATIAVGILLTIAAVTGALVLGADLIVAHVGTILQWAFIVAVGVGFVGLVLLLRDEQRARRAARGDDVRR